MRRADRGLPRAPVAREHLLPLLQPATAAFCARDLERLRRHRLRRPDGVRRADRRRVGGHCSLRPSADPRRSPRLRSSPTTSTTAGAWPRCCSSSWPRRRARSASPASPPACCRTTARCSDVFHQAGFEVTSRFTDGVIEVELGIEPTPEALAKIEDRARIGLCPLGAAHPAAGVGRRGGCLAVDRARSATRWCGASSSVGFNGPVYPVNPDAGHVASVGRTRRCSTCPTRSTSP